jgi:hypothetical protein
VFGCWFTASCGDFGGFCVSFHSSIGSCMRVLANYEDSIMRRRKRYAAVPAGSAAVVSDPYGGGHDGFHKQPVVSVSEFRR